MHADKIPSRVQVSLQTSLPSLIQNYVIFNNRLLDIQKYIR